MTEGCGDEGKSKCHASENEIIQNIRRDNDFRNETNRIKCERGNKNYCGESTAKILAFGITALIGGVAAETFILGGGAAAATDATLWGLQRASWRAGWALSDAAEGALAWLLNKVGQNSRAGQVLMATFDNIALHNPKSSTMVIGQFPNYVNAGKQNGYTYYQLPNIVYNALNRAGWSQTNNANAIINSVQTGRNILIDAPNYIGPGLQFELGILNNLRYPSQWLNGPP